MTAPTANPTTDEKPADEKQQPTVAATAPRTPAQIAAEQERTARRRALRLPHILTGGVSAAGMAAWCAGEVASTAGGSPLLVTAATAGLSAAGLAVAWRWRENIEERWRRVALRAGVAAAGLITLDSWYGATWGTLGITVVAGATLGAAWRREHNIPLERLSRRTVRTRGAQSLLPWWKPDEPVMAAEVAPVVVTAPPSAELIREVQAKWGKNIARPGGPLVGSDLIEPRSTEAGGARFVIQTVPGSTQFSELEGALGKIAGGLERDIGDLELERYPGNASRAYLTVSSGGDALINLIYSGPQYLNGVIPLGVDSSNETTLSVVVKDETGVHPVLITGAPRSGKTHSGLLPIVMALKASKEWLVVYCDGDPAGGSSALLNELSDSRPGKGAHDAYQQLLAIEETLIARGLLMPTLTEDALGNPIPMTDPAVQTRASKILPCPAYPGIAWVMDEFWRLSKDRWLKSMGFVGRVEQIVRLGPKYGATVAVSTHSILVQDYGDSTPLRGMLSARNALVFRNTNRTEVGIVAGVEVKPYELPAGGGYFFLPDGGTRRKARGGEIKDIRPWAHLLTGATPDHDTADSLAALQTGVDFDPIVAAREAREALAAHRARQAAGQAGTPVEPDEYAQYGAMADLHRLIDNIPKLTVLQGGGEDGPLSISQLKMLAALPGKNAHVAKHAALSVSYVEKQLPRLAELGYAEQPEKFGPYRRTPAGDKAVSDAAGELDEEADRELAGEGEEAVAGAQIAN